MKWERISTKHNRCVIHVSSLFPQSIIIIQGGFFNWPPPPHAWLNRALVHGLAVHEEVGAS